MLLGNRNSIRMDINLTYTTKLPRAVTLDGWSLYDRVGRA